MIEKQKDLCEQISSIIKDYRSGELDIIINAAHVEKWATQFSKNTQKIVLAETLHILSTWYYPKSKIKDYFLVKIENFLTKKYKFNSEQEMLKEIAFVSVQKVGNSQKQLVEMMRELVHDQYMVSLNVDNGTNYMHYVYIDDGLYSGSRARKDIRVLIEMLPKGSTLDVFYLVAGTQNFSYTVETLKECAVENSVILSFYSAFPLCNNHVANRTDDGGFDRHERTQTCLWPDILLENEESIKEYQTSLCLSAGQEYYLYRRAPWTNDKGIFTSVQNRNIVEKEFLKKGIEIVKSIHDPKGKYPLGYNTFPSFGLGSFCASDLNISNTCPLVLWWSIDWYPLLPRRVNDKDSNVDIINFKDSLQNNEHHVDQYNMCPDCGNYFGLETDGGNGYCINCTWNH